MSFVRRLHAVLVILTLVVVLPGRAHAVTTSSWPSVSICTDVDFTSARVYPNPQTREWVVTGYVRACPGAADPQARWTVVQYQTRGLGLIAGPMPYGAPDGPGYRFLFQRSASPNVWAACVVNHVQPSEVDPSLSTANRVACVGADPAGASTDAVHVPVDDVRFVGLLLTGEEGPRPACGSCV